MAEMVNLESNNTVEDNVEKLKKIFPDIVKDGKIDFDILKLILGEEIETDNENYKFEWIGKKNCYKSIQTPSNGTLMYNEDDSVNPELGENIIIKGDNLEVLKLLQSSYKNSIKMIYIDPPYNTGKDFVYSDNFETPLENYFELTGQIINGEATQASKSKFGRKHTQWLNMMLPRLILSKTLLRKEDGVIFISIDDNEIDNLKRLCNDVFGEENFISTFIWRKKSGGSNDSNSVAVEHEYIVCYGNIDGIYKLPLPEKTLKNYKFEDEKVLTHGKYSLKNLNDKSLSDSSGLHYDIECPDGTVLKGDEHQWKCNLETFNKRLKDNRIVFQKDRSGAYGVFYKIYLNEEKGELKYDDEGNIVQKGINPNSLIIDLCLNRDGNDDIKKIFNSEKPFDYPKPVKLIQHLMSISTRKKSEDIILDFFAGSGTTGQATLELNEKDNGNRKFIMVQLPEKIKNSEYEDISQITVERTKRVIRGYGQNPTLLQDGFKVFELGNSNYRLVEKIKVDANSDKKELIKQLKTTLFADNALVDNYKKIDVIYEVILKEGLSLNSDITEIDAVKNNFYKIVDNKKRIYICLDQKIDISFAQLEEFRTLSKETLIVCLDAALTDSDKANLSTNYYLKTI